MAKRRSGKTEVRSEASAAETGGVGRPGRPPGTPNHDYSAVVSVPGVACPHCGSDDVVVVQNLSRLPSTIAAGMRVDRHRMLCRGCLRRFVRLTRLPATAVRSKPFIHHDPGMEDGSNDPQEPDDNPANQAENTRRPGSA